MDRLAVGLGALFFIYLLWKIVTYDPERRKKLAPAVEAETRRLIQEHVRALATKKTQLTYRDAYGVQNTRRWDKEKEHFYDKVVCPSVEAARWNWPLVST